jgi:hypothetical protein
MPAWQALHMAGMAKQQRSTASLHSPTLMLLLRSRRRQSLTTLKQQQLHQASSSHRSS